MTLIIREVVVTMSSVAMQARFILLGFRQVEEQIALPERHSYIRSMHIAPGLYSLD